MHACSVLGDESVIKGITNKELTEHYNYVMKNSEIVINVVGNIKDHEELASQIYTDLLITFKKDVPHEIVTNIDKYTIPEKIKEKTEMQQISQSVVAIGAKICGVNEEDTYATLVYNRWKSSFSYVPKRT
mgnify:CR=1 FL=1